MDNELVTSSALSSYLNSSGICDIASVSISETMSSQSIDIEFRIQKCDDAFKIIKQLSTEGTQFTVNVDARAIRCRFSKSIIKPKLSSEPVYEEGEVACKCIAPHTPK